MPGTRDRRHGAASIATSLPSDRWRAFAQDDENRKLIVHLYTKRDALFIFLTHLDTDATNWRAEQAIRPAVVVNRKVWRGNRPGVALPHRNA
jgi:transposase